MVLLVVKANVDFAVWIMAKMKEKKKKVLFVATVDSHIELFHLPYLKMFKERGYEVHVATDTNKPIQYCDKKICLPIKRSPLKAISNYKATRELKKIMNKEHYEIVHCHTPMGGVVARMAGKKARRNGTRMIYTAHGFHFYTGAPLHYWIMFYPVEKYLAKYTDTLITINDEDYQRAKKRFSERCRDIQYVPGVGVDEKKFAKKLSAKEKSELRKSLGLKDDDKVLICVGRLDKNKNQGFLIEVLSELIKEDKCYHLLLVGPDEINGKYENLAKRLKVENNVHFLGFCGNVSELMQASDIAVSSSKREGLPVNLIEAGMVGLPIVAADCRGNSDVCAGYGGLTYTPDNQKELINSIKLALSSSRHRIKKSHFSSENVNKSMITIYSRKKRILHLLASNKYSGAENIACMIIDNLSNKYEMAYCSLSGPIEKVLKQRDIKFYGIDRLNSKNLHSIIDQFNPDTIHAHDFRASLLASKYASNINVVSHIHQNNPRVQKATIEAILYKFASKRFSTIIWVSEEALNDYRYKRSVSKKSIVLRNIVDQCYIKGKVDDYIVERSFDLIFLGRLIDIKNPERALRLVNSVKEHVPEVALAIVGDGEERGKIEYLINKYNMGDNIVLFGFMENPYPILSNSKILLITSKREGTPISLLEAQALDKPIISTKIQGFEKLISNGINGFLSDDDDTLKRRIIETLDDEEYKKLSDGTKRMFSKNNDIIEYLNTVCLIYNDASHLKRSCQNEENT